MSPRREGSPPRGSLRDHADLVAAIGARLGEFRRAARYTQEQVSEHTGINRSGLSDIENGQRVADAVELLHLARLYRTSVDELLDTDGTGTPAQPEAAIAVRLLQATERLEAVEIRLRGLTRMEGEAAGNDPGSSNRTRQAR